MSVCCPSPCWLHPAGRGCTPLGVIMLVMALQPWQGRGTCGAAREPVTVPGRPPLPGAAQVCQVKVLLPWGLCRDLAVATMEGSPQAPALMAAQGPVKASTAVTVDSPCVLPLCPPPVSSSWAPGCGQQRGTGYAECSSAVGEWPQSGQSLCHMGSAGGTLAALMDWGEGKGVQGDLRLRRGEHVCFDLVRLSPEAPQPSLIHAQGRAAWARGTGRGQTGHSPTQPPGVPSSSSSERLCRLPPRASVSSVRLSPV